MDSIDTVRGIMEKNILEDILPLLIGKKCCRVRVGASKSLSMGFGEKIYHNNNKLEDAYYGEWEIGTYYCAWRVIKGDKIMCGASDPTESIEELNRDINRIKFGSIVSIAKLTSFDVRVEFDNEIVVDFLPTISDQDELFHIFCPDNLYIELSFEGKWLIGKSNAGAGVKS